LYGVTEMESQLSTIRGDEQFERFKKFCREMGGKFYMMGDHGFCKLPRPMRFVLVPGDQEDDEVYLGIMDEKKGDITLRSTDVGMVMGHGASISLKYVRDKGRYRLSLTSGT